MRTRSRADRRAARTTCVRWENERVRRRVALAHSCTYCQLLLGLLSQSTAQADRRSPRTDVQAHERTEGTASYAMGRAMRPYKCHVG